MSRLAKLPEDFTAEEMKDWAYWSEPLDDRWLHESRVYVPKRFRPIDYPIDFVDYEEAFRVARKEKQAPKSKDSEA